MGVYPARFLREFAADLNTLVTLSQVRSVFLSSAISKKIYYPFGAGKNTKHTAPIISANATT